MSVSQKLLRSFNAAFKEVILGDLPYKLYCQFRIPINDARTFLQQYVDDQIGSQSKRDCSPYTLYQMDTRDAVKEELLTRGIIYDEDPPKVRLSIISKCIGERWSNEKEKCTPLYMKYTKEAEKVNAERMNREIPVNGTYLVFVKSRRKEADPNEIHELLKQCTLKEIREFARRYNILLESETKRNVMLNTIQTCLAPPQKYIDKIKRIQAKPITCAERPRENQDPTIYIENIADYRDPHSLKRESQQPAIPKKVVMKKKKTPSEDSGSGSSHDNTKIVMKKEKAPIYDNSSSSDSYEKYASFMTKEIYDKTKNYKQECYDSESSD